MSDLIDIADLVAETINGGMLPEGSPAAERQWELARPLREFKELRVSVLPIPSNITEDAPDESTRGDEAERVIVQIGVQKQVSIASRENVGNVEICKHDRAEMDAIARVALAIQERLRRQTLSNDTGSTTAVADRVVTMGNAAHLTDHHIFTAILEFEYDLITPIHKEFEL